MKDRLADCMARVSRQGVPASGFVALTGGIWPLDLAAIWCHKQSQSKRVLACRASAMLCCCSQAGAIPFFTQWHAETKLYG